MQKEQPGMFPPRHRCILQKTPLVTFKGSHSPPHLTTTQAKRGVWSHHQSQELLCHRDWCSRREEKLAENQCCVTGKDLQVGGEEGENKRRTGGRGRGWNRNWGWSGRGRVKILNRKTKKFKKRRPRRDKIDQKFHRVSEEMWWWQRRERERALVLIEEVKDIFSGSRPSWCLYRTAAGVRSLFQPWRQLEVSTPRQPQLCLPTKLSHVFVHTAAPLSQQGDTMLAQVPLHTWDLFEKKMKSKRKVKKILPLSNEMPACQNLKQHQRHCDNRFTTWFQTLRQYTDILNG